jgi:signal transduction histidine kinase
MLLEFDIHKRMAVVLWGAALLAFVAAGAGVALYQHFTAEPRARQMMEPYAQLVIVGTDAAVACEDPVRAQEILNTLRANPLIRDADIYLDSGRLLASFSQLPHAKPRPRPTGTDGIYFGDETVELLQDLPKGGRLRIRMGLDQFDRQSQQMLLVFGAGVLILLIVTVAQLVVLRRTIVRPLSALTEATEQVSAKADYRHRVPAVGADEVARLGRSFNAMMGAIQAREDDLRKLTLFQRTILDNAAYGIISATPDGMVTSFNRAAERLLGYAEDEVVGRKSPALWHEAAEVAEYARVLSAEFGETVRPGFGVFSARPMRNLPEEREWTFVRKDGSRVPVNLSVTALRDEDGQISGFVGMVYDLAERKHAEAEIRQLNQELELRVRERTAQLEAANRELEAFSYSVSHDLRSPLRAIEGFSNILLEDYSGKLDEEGKRFLNVVGENTRRMGQLIEDILQFSRTGRTEINYSEIDMAAMAHAVAEEMRTTAPDTLHVEIAPIPTIRGDSAMMRQVFANLFSNAIKFSRNCAVPVIRVGATVKDGEVVYHMQDNGAGFDMHYADQLFGVFKRLHNTSEFEGTGIGLAIVKRIITRHGGRVWAEGKVNGGATFYFALPQAEQP